MRVASKVGNLHAKFGHARPLGSEIIRYVQYVTDGRTDRRTYSTMDRRTDKSNAYCPFSTVGGIVKYMYTKIQRKTYKMLMQTICNRLSTSI